MWSTIHYSSTLKKNAKNSLHRAWGSKMKAKPGKKQRQGLFLYAALSIFSCLTCQSCWFFNKWLTDRHIFENHWLRSYQNLRCFDFLYLFLNNFRLSSKVCSFTFSSKLQKLQKRLFHSYFPSKIEKFVHFWKSLVKSLILLSYQGLLGGLEATKTDQICWNFAHCTFIRSFVRISFCNVISVD